MATTNHFALNWNDHSNHLKKAFDTLLAENEFVDVTISCEGKKIKAHKMLLSACSVYFHDLFRDNPCQHPIVILRDIKFQSLINVLKFVYTGEVSVATQELDDFLKTAKAFEISGLTDEEITSAMIEKEKEVSEKTLATVTNESQEIIPEVKEDDEVEVEKTFKRPSEVSINEDHIPKKIREEEEIVPEVVNPEIKEEFNGLEEEVFPSHSFDFEQHNETAEESLSQINFVVGQRGRRLLCERGFIYKYDKNGTDGKILWRCIEFMKEKCKGRVHTKGNNVIKRASHNHNANQEKIDQKRKMSQIRYGVHNMAETEIKVKQE